MDSRSRNFTIAMGVLILGISCNHGELLTIRRFEQFQGFRVETTCVSENGYAALVWNLREDGSGIATEDFVPRKPKSTEDHPNCAIWENDQCHVNWTIIQDHLVYSGDELMGPVFDYRWESFKGVRGMLNHDKLRKLGSFFSIRNLGMVRVVVCASIDKKCSTIIMEKSIDEAFIMECERGVDLCEFPAYRVSYFTITWSHVPIRELDPKLEPFIMIIFRVNQDADIFRYEKWRTFGINIERERERISIFEKNRVKTFVVRSLERFTPIWYDNFSVTGKLTVKFHHYTYILLKKKDELLSTLDFHLRSEYFCIELFVGLCSDCRLNVDLVSDEGTIRIGSIDGNDNSTIGGLLVWRPVRLNATIPVRGLKIVRLELRSQLKNVNAQGQWAIDSLRWCEPAGSLRKSTITTEGKAGGNSCQKLSYDESVVVRSSRKKILENISVNANEILDSLRGQSDIFGSSLPSSGPVCLICNPTGCTCDRGFEGFGCNVECAHGYFGYGCREECHQCANRSCDKLTGYCAANCSDEKLLPLFCRRGIENTEGQNMIWLTVFSAIPIGILLLVIRYRVRLNSPGSLSETPENVAAESVDCDGYLVPSAALNRRNWIFPAMMNLDNGSLYQDIGFDGPPYDPRNHILEISQFEHYLEDGLASGLLKLQYEHVSDDPPKACEYGKLIPNLAKNRTRDVVAYDETRVSLEKIAGDSYSDYINANYIRGYRQTQAYIATQGPTSNTIGDFWRMVWQEKISLICMVTDLIENGEVLCEQYWPEVEKESKYEFIVVLNAGEVEFDDHVLRTFHVRCGNETREVTHLQYTGSWPNKGVLTYSSSLVTYLKKMLAIPSGEGLVVVHGSLGVGRTGVIILCDICLRRALHDKIINVAATTVRMREDRGNMIENEHCYLLAHVLISGCLLAAETQASIYTEILY